MRVQIYIITTVLFSFFPSGANSQSLKGFFSKLDPGEHYDYYKFSENGHFEYHKGASLGDDYFGKGTFRIENDSLFLNYNRTPKRLKSYHHTKTWYNSSDRVVLEIFVVDENGFPVEGANVLYKEEGEPPKGIVADGEGKVRFTVKKDSSTLNIQVSYIGYDFYEFTVQKLINNEIKVYLMQEGFTRQILGQKEEFLILGREEKSFRLKGRNGIFFLREQD